MVFCLLAPLAGPADNVRSGAAFATSGMTEMGDDRIRGTRDHPEGTAACLQYHRSNTREGLLSLLIHMLQLCQLSLGREREREPESLNQLEQRLIGMGDGAADQAIESGGRAPRPRSQTTISERSCRAQSSSLIGGRPSSVATVSVDEGSNCPVRCPAQHSGDFVPFRTSVDRLWRGARAAMGFLNVVCPDRREERPYG
jgi:hypothetical protein